MNTGLTRHTREWERDYFRAHNAVFSIKIRRGVKPYLIAVYSYLRRCADQNNTCFPSQKDISKKTGMSERMVRTVVKTLAELRVIRVHQESHFHKTRNTYELPPPSLWITRIDAAHSAADYRHGVPPNKTHLNNKDTFLMKDRNELARKFTWPNSPRAP